VRSFGVSLDITERKLAEQALQDADRRKDSFIATLAHELRNPLAPIRNAVQLLRKGGHDDPQVVWCRDVIDRQVTQMARPARGPARRLAPDPRPSSRCAGAAGAGRPVVEHALEIAQPRIDESRASLSVSLPAGAAGDRRRPDPAGAGVLQPAHQRRQVHAERRPARRDVAAVGDEVEVRVSDNGIGISAEQMPRLFEMFSQGDSLAERAQRRHGHRPVARRGLVEMHGGRSRAERRLGQGSEFVVRLPLRRRGTPPARRQATATAAAAPPCRVLVADDLRDSADSLGLLIELMGHAVEVAYDGEEALRGASASGPTSSCSTSACPSSTASRSVRGIRASPGAARCGWWPSRAGVRRGPAPHRRGRLRPHIVKPIDPAALEALMQTARVRGPPIA
jgi:hypothetical protein